jgi:Ppx/GppA phosphatase family
MILRSNAQCRVAGALPPEADAPLAAVDIGSNSFRVEIARMVRGRYVRIDYIKDTVRLGAGLDANGLLGDEAAERGLTCLRRFAAALQGIPPAHVRAVATQTLREARNRDAFLLRAQAALGGFLAEQAIGVEAAAQAYRVLDVIDAHVAPAHHVGDLDTKAVRADIDRGQRRVGGGRRFGGHAAIVLCFLESSALSSRSRA